MQDTCCNGYMIDESEGHDCAYSANLYHAYLYLLDTRMLQFLNFKKLF